MAALATKTLLRQHPRQFAPVLAGSWTSSQQRRHAGTNLAAIKRGKGGRSSFSGLVVTVLGASGFIGRYVVNQLGKIGSQVICPYRGEPYYSKDLKLAGDLGQILFMPYDIRDDVSLHQVMKYSNVVINLVGRDWETRNFSFEDVHVLGAARIARVARECGVERLIHFSALNASPNPQPIMMKGGSNFLRSKYEGEQAVKEKFPDVTIFRPADVYGPEDRFIRYYANHWRRSFRSMPLWRRGEETIKMPVFCMDVAKGVTEAILDPTTAGKTYECVGPNSFLLSELVDYFYRCIRWDPFYRLPINPVFLAKLKLMSYLPSYPILTMEKLEMEHVSDVVHGNLTLEDLNVKLTRLQDRAPYELKPYRLHSYYLETVGEFPDPIPPTVLA